MKEVVQNLFRAKRSNHTDRSTLVNFKVMRLDVFAFRGEQFAKCRLLVKTHRGLQSFVFPISPVFDNLRLITATEVHGERSRSIITKFKWLMRVSRTTGLC